MELNIIRFTKVKLPYGWLSNMSNHSIKHTTQTGVVLETKNAEALFQGLRYPKGSSVRAKILHTKNPMAAKKLAKQYIDYISVMQLSTLDLTVMKYVVGLKLLSNPNLIDELLKLDINTTIIEDVSNRIGDFKSSSLFWGAALMGQKDYCEPYWVGKNNLGWIYQQYLIKLKKGTEPLRDIVNEYENMLITNNIL